MPEELTPQEEIVADQLVINQMTKEQYESITPNIGEIYLVPDTTDEDIADAIEAHNESEEAHPDIRALISQMEIPSQEGQEGKVLGTDGSTLQWVDISSTTYIHNQALASNTWTIQHNQNNYPSVSVVDSAGTVVRGKVDYIDEDTVQITFNGEFKGKAYLN